MFSVAIAIIGLAAHGAAPPPSHCRLREANALLHRWSGSCGRLFNQEPTISLKPAKTIVSGRWRSDRTPTAVWSGALTDSSSISEIELEIYDDGSGILRTERNWFVVSAFTVSPTSLAFDLDTERVVPPSDLDYAIVRRADVLLSSTTVWNRADDRNCPGTATTLSIYCAMERATIEMTCGPHHRRPAMQVVRQIVDERSAGRGYDHRLMDYNNDSRTTLADVHSLFVAALTRMHAPVDAPAPTLPVCPPPPAPVITELDVKTVERAQAILIDATRWNKDDRQQCPSSATTFSIYCVLKRASEETVGEFDEVSVVMQEARQVVDFVAPREYEGRLVGYNSDPATSFADIQAFFRILRNRLARRVTR